MRELLYTVLELEEWCSKNAICDFCSWFENKNNKAVCQIRTRTKTTGSLVENDKACESCKEKFENNEIPKCERCGRLRIKDDVCNGKYVCRCIKRKEDLEEKELPNLPHQRESMSTFYERQINGLREEKEQLTEEVDTHLEALEVSKDWHERQKQELLDKIDKLEAENKRLKDSTPQELINELNSCKEKIKALETQLEQLASQQTAQIETPAKENKIKNFFKFGSK